MKKIHALLLAASVLFAASCQEEIASPEAENPEVGTSTLEVITITATTQSETKTALEGLSTLWVEGDMISVFDANKDGNNRCFPVVEITNENKTATFSYEKGDFKMDHTQKDPTLVALYPYQESAYCDFFYYDRNYIENLVVPAEQTAVANGFDANATFAIALGTMNTRESLNFQNLYSLLKFHVETPNVTSVTVTVGGENAYIAGDAKVQMQLNKELINNEEGKPVFFDPVLSALPDGGSKSVTLKCEEGFSTDEDVFYYIAVAPTTIESVQVAINETVVKSATKKMPFEANKIHSLGKLDYNRIDRELAFSDVPTTAVVGGDFDEPELTGTTDGVKYRSSNTDVATVDESTGEVTLVGVGETTITASAPKTDALLAGEATYTLTVTKATRTISFSQAPAEVTYGEDYAEPTLTVTPEASATYSVTKGDEAVTVNPSTGEVTINKAADVVEITATVEATDSYEKATASYTFKVNKANRTISFNEHEIEITYGDKFTGQKLADVTDVSYEVISGDGAATVEAETGEVKIVKAGTVTIKATVAETDAYNVCAAEYKLTIKNPDIWGLCGSFNGWKLEDAIDMTYDGDGWYQVTNVEIYKDDAFKFVKDKKWDTNYGGGNVNVGEEKTLSLNGGNMIVNKSGKHTLRFNPDEKKLTVQCTDEYSKTKYDLYVKPNSNWKQSDARFAAYFFGDGETWVSMEECSDGTYGVNKPTGKNYTSVIFVRMDPGKQTNDWSSTWGSQTNDLSIPSDGNNLYTIKDGTWNKGGGTWSKKN